MKNTAAFAATLPPASDRLHAGLDVPRVLFAVGLAAGQRRRIEAAGLVAARRGGVDVVLRLDAIADRKLRRHVGERLLGGDDIRRRDRRLEERLEHASLDS